MALTETNIVDKIEVVENGSVQVRTASVIFRDDKEISRAFHRHVLPPEAICQTKTSELRQSQTRHGPMPL